MSRENVEIIRRGYEYFRATGGFNRAAVPSGFVWDMSKFRGWPERQVYEGIDGARSFIRDWSEAWDDWEVELEPLRDAGEQVVAIVRQRGNSKATGLPVDMLFAQVWTVRDGRQTRMEMYADPIEALKAVGLAE
jgi:ketosteroid isomerase-like protein